MIFKYLDKTVEISQISFLNELNIVNSTILVWVTTLVSLFLLLMIVKKLTAGSKSDIDDITIGITSKSLTIILLSIGIVSILNTLDLHDKVSNLFLIINNFVTTVSLLVLVWRLVYKEYIQYYLPNIAKRSESNLDDILVPILQTVFPIVFFIVASLFTLQSLNVDISGWGIIVGSVSFILAFALQNTLADLFAGIALVADSPFGIGDVVKIGNQIAEVKRIGIRITELYVFDEHSTVFIPNSSLSVESITNLTYPTPDVRARMAIGVSYNSNPRTIRKYMREIAEANPYVIGKPEDKVVAMMDRLEILTDEKDFDDEKEELIWGITKWTLEVELLSQLDKFKIFLNYLFSNVDAAEDDGLDDSEIADILQTLREPGRSLLKKVKDVTNKWLEENLQDPNLFKQDGPIIKTHWERKLSRLEMKYESIIKYTEGATMAEKQRIDTKILEFVKWLDEKFKDPYEEWKNPDADFEDMGDNAIIFNFEFFVDDIKSERYERMGRVISDLRRNIFEKLTSENIEIPFPQRDVWFRNSIPKDKT